MACLKPAQRNVHSRHGAFLNCETLDNRVVGAFDARENWFEHTRHTVNKQNTVAFTQIPVAGDDTTFNTPLEVKPLA